MTSNRDKGKAFQRQVHHYFTSMGIEVKEEFEIEIGMNGQYTKPHKFDLGNGSLLVECKSYSWTKTNKNPSAKFLTANEALLFFLAAPESFQKILFLSETDKMGKRNLETLGERYVRTYEHLFPDGLKIFELSIESLFVRQLWPLKS